MQKSTDSKLQWEDVRYFLALAREGSLSGAARALTVEHSTVGRRVEALEQSLGLRLFNRLPRGWQLTAEGEELVVLGERVEDEAFAFERAAVGAGALRGTVRISAPPSLATMFIVPRIAALSERWSGIDLEVMNELREVNLSRREADMALRLGRPREPGLVVRSLGKIGMGLYARADYTATRSEEEWEFIGFEESLRHVPHYRWFAQFVGKRRFVLRSNDQIAMHGAARAGLGIACLAHYQGRNDVELTEVPTPSSVSRDVWLVLHADVRRSPRVRAIADLVCEIFDEAAGFLAG